MAPFLARALPLGLFFCLAATPAMATSSSWSSWTGQAVAPQESPNATHASWQPSQEGPAYPHGAQATQEQVALEETVQKVVADVVEEVLACTHMPRIALTFDDGPFQGTTKEILDILAERGVPATFFVVGRQALAHPHLVQLMVDQGHEIAVHSHTHADLSRLGPEGQAQEIRMGWEALSRAAPGAIITHWRAPYGAIEGVDMAYPKSLGLRHVSWSIDTLDWQRPTQGLWLDRILSQARDGAIVLMHDHAHVSRHGLVQAIEALWGMGFVFRTVSGLSEPACYDSSGTLHPD